MMKPGTFNRVVIVLLSVLFVTALSAWARSPQVPPVVEQQLRAKARAENPHPAGLHLSQDGESYTYASASPAASRGKPGAGGYQATLGRRLSGGIEVSADRSDLSLKVWPVSDALSASPAVEKDGRLVYSGRGVRYEYAFKKNGVKEDIVLESAPSGDVGLLFALQQDGNLDFRLDAKGNVLVYGPDALLSGFVQTGDDKSAELLMNARRKAKKDHLLFLIPAPAVFDNDGRRHKDLAHYTLEGNALTLHTSDLSRLKAPVTIDPSIVVATTADFMMGNDEGMISFDTDAISRAMPSGGTIGAWASTTIFPMARYGHTSVAYGGYLYVIGGYDGSPTFLNDVEFAPINPDGTVGAWSATTSFATGRFGHTSVAYNGYLYILGGAGGGGVLNDVQSAPIHADGTVGPWSATTSFSTGRYYYASVAYNGHIYVVGGNSGLGFLLNDVQFAAFNANGTVGTWNSTTSFATARAGHTAVAYNGYLYVIGGSDPSFNALDGVQYSHISADGTLGIWSPTTSFGTPSDQHSSVAYNGYLYVIGGRGPSYLSLNDVQCAPINANGTIGGWNVTTSFNTARAFQASVASCGYIYVVGGSGGGFLNDIQFAPIDPNGVVGAWTATASLPTARNYPASVAYNGYLYVLGGYSSSGMALNDVQYAPINSDGTVGPTWTAASSFTSGRFCHTSVAYNGYLYVIGGWGGDTTYYDDVQYAPIHSDGTVGPTWTATSSFSVARYNHASVAYNGYLYVIGGWSGGSSKFNDVQYAPINSNGTIGGWNTTLPFTTGRAGHASVAYGGYLYVIGGYSASSLNDVQFAPVNSDGTVGAWGTTTSFSTPRYYHASVAYNGYLYVIGGNTDSGRTDDVQVAPIHAGGTVGTWTSTTVLPTPSSSHASVAYNGYLYVIGGYDTACLDRVLFAPINASGTTGAWSATASFATPRGNHASVAYNGFLYVIGGWNGTYLNDVQFAPINADGTVGPWSTTSSFPSARYGHASVAYNGFLYVIGGWNGSSRLDDVEFAPIHANGTVGTWTASNSFSSGRVYLASAAYHGYLYVSGGWNDSGFFNDVQFAPVNSSGTIGSWTATTSFATARDSHTLVAYNGYMYLLGGYDGSSFLNDVQFAPVNANGSIGSWSATASFDTARENHTSVAFNGYLYAIGGWNGSDLNDVQFAPIQSNGTLGAWSPAASLAVARDGHTSVAYSGYLYVIGGSSGGTLLSDVQVATLSGPAARGAYSKLLDTGAGGNVMQSLAFDGAGGGGGRTLTYAVASDSDGVFGARTTIADAVPGFAYAPNQCGRYVWVRFDLNDCDSATVDSGGTLGRKDVTNITLTYSPLTGIGDSLNGTKATTAVHLAWSASPGATSYNILRCDATGGHCTPAPIDNTSNLYYDDSVLGDGSTYWYAIVAVNGSCTAP